MSANELASASHLLDSGAAALGIALEPERIERLVDLGCRILEKSRSVNLTGARDLPTLIEDHIVDSLSLVPFMRTRTGAQGGDSQLLVDVGSGGGFPALPLAIVLDRLDVLCIESIGKKARLLVDLCETGGLDRVTVINDRAERVAHDRQWRAHADWATARALGRLATACELTLPFLRVGGVMLAQKGADPQTEVAEASEAIAQLGGLTYSVTGEGRTIVMIEKVAATPDRFPRRPGMPAKRPLGGGRKP